MPAATFQEALDDNKTRGYFNSAQALADYAEVLLHVKDRFSAHNSPIIVVGGSYGGSKYLEIRANILTVFLNSSRAAKKKSTNFFWDKFVDSAGFVVSAEISTYSSGRCSFIGSDSLL